MTENTKPESGDDLDLAAIRASVVKHCRDYLSEVPVAERSPSMLKAIVDVLVSLGGSVEQDIAKASRARLPPLALPFALDSEGNEVPTASQQVAARPSPSARSPASGTAIPGLD